MPARLARAHLRYDFVRPVARQCEAISRISGKAHGRGGGLHFHRARTQSNDRETGIALPESPLMMRPVVTCVWMVAAAASVQAEDAREIIRRAVGNDQQDFQGARSYTYVQRQETRELDRSGQVKSRKIETWDITLLEGSPYRKLVARNDKALSPEEQKAEEERLRWNNDQRRMETQEPRAQRLAQCQRRL